MNLTKTATVLTLTTAAFCFANMKGTAGQDGGKPMEAAMDMVATSGKMHELLKPFAGTWNVSAKFMTPDGEMESGGTMTNTWILGDLVLEQRYDSEIMGMPFQGLGLWAYSPTEEAYQTVWVDSMTGSIDFVQGMDVSDDGQTFTAYGVQKMGGPETKYRDVTKVISAKKHTFKRYLLLDEGEKLSMDITYTR